MTSVSGLVGGWATVLVIAYTLNEKIYLAATQYSQQFGGICTGVLGQRAGLALFSLNIIAQFFVGQGITITASRIVFAFARDGALPASKQWSHVDRRTQTPVIATWGVLWISALLGLLMFASPVAIGAVFSLGAIAQYTSFTFPVALKLLFAGDEFKPGPWNLGRWSKPINACACLWWLLIVPAMSFPAFEGEGLNPFTMNWTCLIYGGPMLLATLFYAVSARRWFKGPRVNTPVVYGMEDPVILQQRQAEEK